MKLRPFLVPVLLLTSFAGLVAWLLLVEPPAPPEEQIAGTLRPGISDVNNDLVETAPDAPEPATADSANQGAAPLPDNIRDVSPDGVSAPDVDGGLTRIEPSERYQELINPPVEPVPDGPLELRRVQVLDGGRIKSNKLFVTLAHIEPIKLDETCVARQGGLWPCGAR
ncbi:MAG: hypothetical protein AAFN16_26740, partial [Pseudomonadota bacterium]